MLASKDQTHSKMRILVDINEIRYFVLFAVAGVVLQRAAWIIDLVGKEQQTESRTAYCMLEYTI